MNNSVVILLDFIVGENVYDVHVMDATTNLTDKYESYTKQGLSLSKAHDYIDKLERMFGDKVRYIKHGRH